MDSNKQPTTQTTKTETATDSVETVATRLKTWHEDEPIPDKPTCYDGMYPEWRQDERDGRRSHMLRIARIAAGIQALGDRGVLASARILPKARRHGTGDVLGRFDLSPCPCYISLHGIEGLMEAYGIDPDVDMSSPVPSGPLL